MPRELKLLLWNQPRMMVEYTIVQQMQNKECGHKTFNFHLSIATTLTAYDKARQTNDNDKLIFTNNIQLYNTPASASVTCLTQHTPSIKIHQQPFTNRNIYY